ncbi:thermonuclease family protein [Methylobacterium nigriterrae]|uniref:thermonuclease family protein n=1 Tax=Methylobacterium nigriterrae TaxID=3127512 RepID=UPI00301342B8
MLRPTALLLLLTLPAMSAESITGPATVIDGDTIEVRGTRLHLLGIDAPEVGQTCENAAGRSYPCGRIAAHALAEQIGGNPVTCEPHRTAEGDRAVAVCRVGREDLSAWMAAHGHALADRRRSHAYIRQEGKAWATRRGLWAGTFEQPADWRHTSRHAEAAAAPAKGD